MQDIFKIVEPRSAKVPILLSSPHSGVSFPKEVHSSFRPEVLSHPEDTDWFIDQLYDFVPDLGVTLIAANYSRYLIDLNRDPASQSLYADGRCETSLVPLRSFSAQSLYLQEPSEEEVQRRRQKYYQPYHQELKRRLEEIKKEFGFALLFEAHSIKDHVPRLHPNPFPSLILGNNDSLSCDSIFLQKAQEVLQSQGYQVSVNHPFKGGFITRSLGRPNEGIHSLQLEMCQSLYMDEGQKEYDEKRAMKVKQALQKMFEALREIK